MVVMTLLEGLRHFPTGVGAKAYFNELETYLNNIILAESQSNSIQGASSIFECFVMTEC